MLVRLRKIPNSIRNYLFIHLKLSNTTSQYVRTVKLVLHLKNLKLVKQYWAGIDPIVHTKYGYLDYPNYFENFSTTYDLSFNHYPQWYKKSGNISRKLRFRTMHYEPVDDYIASFNNITRSGLLEKKKEDWCEDKWRTFFPRKTHTEDVYKPPSLNDYHFPRHAPPKRNSSKLYTPNINAAKQNLRFNGPSFSVVPHFQLVQGPRKPRCDPITWECPND